MATTRWMVLALLFCAGALARAEPVTLQGRDITGRAVAHDSADAVFLYSAERNLTWLRDWDIGGRQTWYQKMDWASNLDGSTVGAFIGGWSLPSIGQLMDLWRDVGCTLGSASRCYGLSDAGFTDLYEAPMVVWSSTATDDATSPLRRAYYFTLDFGYPFMDTKSLNWRATAVRTGDVLVAQQADVPEPGSLALALAALAALTASVSGRRRAR